MNKDAISKLIDSNGYSADAIPELEKYVEHQITSNEYDFEANHALLKLYQFHPSKSNKKFVAQILIKALAQTPASDFMLHLYVIPESVTTDEVVANVIIAHDLLERAHFKDFWTRVQGAEFDMPGFKANIRSFIVDVVSKTYRSIAIPQLAELLNYSANEIADVIKSQEKAGWKVSGDLVTFPKDMSSIKPKQTAEVLQFEQFGRILSSLR